MRGAHRGAHVRVRHHQLQPPPGWRLHRRWVLRRALLDACALMGTRGKLIGPGQLPSRVQLLSGVGWGHCEKQCTAGCWMAPSHGVGNAQGLCCRILYSGSVEGVRLGIGVMQRPRVLCWSTNQCPFTTLLPCHLHLPHVGESCGALSGVLLGVLWGCPICVL